MNRPSSGSHLRCKAGFVPFTQLRSVPVDSPLNTVSTSNWPSRTACGIGSTRSVTTPQRSTTTVKARSAIEPHRAVVCSGSRDGASQLVGPQRFVVVRQNSAASRPVADHRLDEGAICGLLGVFGLQTAPHGSLRRPRDNLVFANRDRQT